MTEPSQAIRKACDFCYKRKIKCNGAKPYCSNCATHERQCTYGTPSRQYKPKNRKGTAKTEGSTDELKSRIQQLEAVVSQLTERVHDDPGREWTQAQPRSFGQLFPTSLPTNLHGSIDNSRCRSMSFHLPPKQLVIPLVHQFIENFNAVLPLFYPESLLRLVRETYNTNLNQRDPIAWATINVVLALTYQQGLMGAASIHESAEYINKVQSVLSEVMLGKIELLNLQVLVGMVMLIEGSEDLQPALILIATTLRLAHTIGLHDRTSAAHVDPALARQRSYVFWIAYILDKDLSLRSKQPSIQLDDDIDLDLPGSQNNGVLLHAVAEIDNESNKVGIIGTVDGSAHFDYFTARIQLAVIQGGVYDYLYSTRAQNRTPEERMYAMESVSKALEQWKACIPPEFMDITILNRAAAGTLRFICDLHGTSLACTTSVNQAHLMSGQWVSSLRKSGTDGSVPLLPLRWEVLVYEARTMMVLFERSAYLDRYRWWYVFGLGFKS
jgi:hypothetical protein